MSSTLAWCADTSLPGWIVEMLEILDTVSDAPAWKDLTKAWVEFEGLLGYPDGQVSINRIPILAGCMY